MGHDSSKMGDDSGKIAILDSTWELRGWFFKVESNQIATTEIEQSPASPLHALRAEGTVADIYIYIYIYRYKNKYV